MAQKELKELIVDNAERLLEDALILFDKKRYASASALAVLSIEEFGKISSDMEKGHARKLEGAAKYMLLTQFIDNIYKSGFAIKPITELTTEQKQWLKTQTSRKRQIDMLKDAWLNASSSKIIKELYDNIYDINTLKKRGIYLDFDQNGNIISIPSSITREAAKNILDMAQEAITSYRENQNKPL